MRLDEWVEIYDDLGFNCFPLKFESKEPAITTWKEYQTTKYKGDFKEGNNVAIVTGKISNLIVIDLDHKALARIIFKKWDDILHNTLVIETRRGFHIYCKPKSGQFPPTAKFTDAQGRGIDIKSEGGYVVAPPSIHPDGGKYKVISICHVVEELDIDNFVKELNKHGFGGGLKKAKLTDVLEGGVKEGARNDSAYVMARQLLNPSEKGLEVHLAWEELRKWNQSCTPPLEKEELDRIFESAQTIPFEERPLEFSIKTFKRNYVARHVTVTLHPKTLRENKEIYVYQNGLYVDGGETYIEEMLHRLYYGIPRSEVSELLATIRATTYVTHDDFDTYPELIHLKNCILNVKNMKVFEQTHELLTRNQIQTIYQPGARCPKILKFLTEIMPDGAELKTLIQLLASIILHKVKLEKAIIFVGEQANGKSTLIELLISILGAQNISNVALQRLANNRFALATMVGKILNAYGDLDIDAIEQTGLIKEIISQSHVMIEKKNKDAYSAVIPIRLLYSANKLPEFPNADKAIFRRFWVVPFPVVIPPGKRNLNLLEELTTPEEKSGFLNILLLNAKELLHKNFKFVHYQSLEKTQSIWASKSDSISMFVETEVKISPKNVINCQTLFEYYRNWCLEKKEKVVTYRMFFAKLEGLGPFSKGQQKEGRKSIRVMRGLTTLTMIKEENQKGGQNVL